MVTVVNLSWLGNHKTWLFSSGSTANDAVSGRDLKQAGLVTVILMNKVSFVVSLVRASYQTLLWGGRAECSLAVPLAWRLPAGA